MKYRIFAFITLSVLVLTLGGSTLASLNARRSGAELVPLLPSSDGVMILDVKRFFGDALPKLLSGNPSTLSQITGHIDKFHSTTGIDIRQFDSMAIGITAKQIADKKYDIDPVVIARGQMTSASLIGAAKLAANGKYKEERIGERTIYIFSPIDLATSNHASEIFKDGIAVTAVDSTTLAFGTLARVRQTVEGKTKVGTDITSLLQQQNPSAVTSFAAKMPPGMKSFLPLENDELGKNIDSIQYVFGNANVAADVASVHVTARTLQNAQATSLHETLSGLQIFGKAILSGAKGADKQVYARLIDNARFSVKGNDVNMDLQVPQGDIDILIGAILK
ncbi:MAG: hypothetical protein DMF63_07250 [Acidobacteria bacterium]|nr:MAG: hypothetical protein DMF63_07250 [Acidobacteriota bacterium]